MFYSSVCFSNYVFVVELLSLHLFFTTLEDWTSTKNQQSLDNHVIDSNSFKRKVTNPYHSQIRENKSSFSWWIPQRVLEN